MKYFDARRLYGPLRVRSSGAYPQIGALEVRTLRSEL